jgi:hypothetical protein
MGGHTFAEHLPWAFQPPPIPSDSAHKRFRDISDPGALRHTVQDRQIDPDEANSTQTVDLGKQGKVQ